MLDGSAAQSTESEHRGPTVTRQASRDSSQGPMRERRAASERRKHKKISPGRCDIGHTVCHGTHETVVRRFHTFYDLISDQTRLQTQTSTTTSATALPSGESSPAPRCRVRTRDAPWLHAKTLRRPDLALPWRPKGPMHGMQCAHGASVAAPMCLTCSPAGPTRSSSCPPTAASRRREMTRAWQPWARSRAGRAGRCRCP